MTQEKFLEYADSGRNIFLTGKGGTGKSYILQEWCNNNKHKKVIKVGPTGISAINIGGATIHSTFKLYGTEYRFIKRQIVNWKEIDCLIIDEISMVSCDLFDYIDKVLKNSRRSLKPFGGIQVIAVGDLAQLQPIFSGADMKRYHELIDYRGGVTFNFSKVYKEGRFKECNLIKIRRTKDEKLIKLLNSLRSGDQSVVDNFKDYSELKDDNDYVHIAPFNNMVDSLNCNKLSAIPAVATRYIGTSRGKFNLNNVITPEELDLKVGARVMLTKNNQELGMFNGDLGTVIKLGEDFVEMHSDRLDKNVTIGREKWKAIEYDDHGNEMEVGSFIQIPLKLSWAITGHKCIAGDQLIKGVQGRFQISNGQIGDKVYTANGINTIIGKEYMGKKETIKLTTRSGFELVSTKDHRILSGVDGVNQYIETGQLSIGNKICIDRSLRLSGNKIEIPVAELSSRSKEVNYSKYIEEDLSYYIGVAIGDGSYNYTKDGRIDIESMDKEVINNITNLYDKLGINYKIKDKSYSKSKSIIAISKNFRDTLKNIGLDYVIGKDKTIPDIYFNIGYKNRAALLRGLFDTDGSINNVIRFSSTSKKLIDQIKLMLLDFGIISSITTNNLYSDKHNQSYALNINGANIVLFRKHIGFNIGYKKSKLDMYVTKGKTNVDFIINKDEIVNEFKELVGGKGSKGKGYRDTSIRRFINNDNISYTHLEKMKSLADERGIELPILNKTLEQHYYYDEIISIEEIGTQDVYDLEIDTDHSFIAQGVIVHNCQGLTLDKIVVHTQGMKSLEQLYTAISRGTTYDNIYIKS